MCLSPYFTSEPTELTGLFLEKPPENVVAVSGMSQHGRRKICLYKAVVTAFQELNVCLGVGRNRCLLHSQGGLNHPNQKTHHEVAEGEVDGPWQQGREAHAV